MSLTASHSQNTRTKKVNMTLPTFNASVERVYPFVKRNGQKKVFLKISTFNIQLEEKIELKQQIHYSLKKKCLMMQYME